MKNTNNVLKFIPLYGGIIIMFKLFIKSWKGECKQSECIKLLFKAALCFAIPFFAVILFLVLSKSFLDFVAEVNLLIVLTSGITLGFLFNKLVIDEYDKILDNHKE